MFFFFFVCVLTDCTLGQHFIFAVPDSVVEATVPPPAQPTQVTNMSCTLQKLTSDPDIYIVPLDGCGITEHVRRTLAFFAACDVKLEVKTNGVDVI